MGPLTRLRSWLAGLFGGEPADSAAHEEPDESEESEESDESDATDDADTGLDPAAATETRSVATDDAVEALQELRRSAPSDESSSDAASEAPGDGRDDAADDDARRTDG